MVTGSEPLNTTCLGEAIAAKVVYCNGGIWGSVLDRTDKTSIQIPSWLESLLNGSEPVRKSLCRANLSRVVRECEKSLCEFSGGRTECN